MTSRYDPKLAAAQARYPRPPVSGEPTGLTEEEAARWDQAVESGEALRAYERLIDYRPPVSGEPHYHKSGPWNSEEACWQDHPVSGEPRHTHDPVRLARWTNGVCILCGFAPLPLESSRWITEGEWQEASRVRRSADRPPVSGEPRVPQDNPDWDNGFIEGYKQGRSEAEARAGAALDVVDYIRNETGLDEGWQGRRPGVDSINPFDLDAILVRAAARLAEQEGEGR